VAVLASLALVSGSMPGAAPDPALAQQDDQGRLSAAREELGAIAERLRAAEADERDADVALEDAQATLDEIERVLNEVAASVERQRASVRDAERRLEAVEREAADLEDAFGARIARLYMQGPELTLELLLSASGADEAIARTMLLERLTEGDQVDLERLEASRVAVDAERERLAAEQLRLEERLEEQRIVREEAEALRADRALAAADAQARSERLAARQDDLEAEEERLEALVRQQQEQERQRQAQAERDAAREASEAASAARSAPSASSGAGSGSGSASTPAASGGYAWPMCAPVTSEYGPRWGRVHRGIDQGASTGTPIGAAKAGTVIFAGWQGGYGNLTLIDHGGAVTAYAHQTRFAVGQGTRVSQGQTIGYVGSTGNSTGPHLHLEIRINGSAVNPRQYLSGSPC
jgi:murein DD-endopeptidase MepM/ murein hydrolase activator NlpD